MKRFEFIDGKSAKFWEVGVTDSSLTVNFGRIGTAGQSKTKSFADNTAALAEEAKLIREKTGKGYRPVGDDGVAAPVATPPVNAAGAKADREAAGGEKAPATTEVPPKARKPLGADAAAAAAVQLVWPEGGFAWTNKLRNELPVMRGVHVLPFEATTGQIATPPKFSNDRNRQLQWADLCEAGASAGELWTPDEAARQLEPDRLRDQDPQRWHQIFCQMAVQHYGYILDGPTPLVWAVELAVALHGLPFAIGVLLDCGPDLTGDYRYGDATIAPYLYLRTGIAAAEEDVYQACLAAGQDRRGRSDQLDCMIAYLFPEQTAWADACVEQMTLAQEDTWWLDDTALSLEPALRHFTRRCIWRPLPMPANLLQIHLHGNQVLPALEMQLTVTFGEVAHERSKEGAREILRLLECMELPETLAMLMALIEHLEVRETMDRLTERWPAACLKTAISHAHAKDSNAAKVWALRLAQRTPALIEPALAACGDEERAYFAALIDALEVQDDAPAEAVPELLRVPPWLRRTPAAEIPVVALTAHEQQEELVWSDADEMDRKQAAAREAIKTAQLRVPKNPERWEKYSRSVLADLYVAEAAWPRILAGETLRPEDLVQKSYYSLSPERLLELSAEAAAAVWNGMPGRHWSDWKLASAIDTLLLVIGSSLIPGLLNVISSVPDVGLAVALPCRSAGIAPLAAHALKNTKKAKAAAAAWLLRHTETAIDALIPAALGANRVPRENAQFCLRWLMQEGYEPQLREIASSYGSDAAAAMDALLAVDPALVVPARMPKLPAFFVPAAFWRPVLKSGGALPVEAAGHLGNMLSISTLQAPYGGLEVVKRACTPDSLGRFAWNLFEAWLDAGAPSKENWAFQALGLIGDDECARRLAPKIREWPGESAHARAVSGLDVLAAIGSDVALMHLNGIAAKVKFKGLQEKAREKIAQVAEARGLTPEELADRLVPDLGLDENGALALDFGPRQFYVSFDESLKPFVKDAAGVRLKDLPKPNRNDDADLAAAAVERYKAVKKDARSIASLQLQRLEQGMCARRRWCPDDFRLFFLEHPLMRHLARRLVWGGYVDGRLVSAFRVAEDLSLADAADDLYELPADVEVGVAHVLEMTADMARDFGQVFADYEIVQPFRQLGRETYALSEQEVRDNAITRFKDKTVATGSIMGLANRGWERGEAQDSGWISWFSKRLPGGLEAELGLDPGTLVGELSFEPVQKIPAIVIRRRGTWRDDGKVAISSLDAIVASELIRDADLLTPSTE